MTTPQRIVVLGSTGSVGRQTLEVIEAQPERFTVVGLAARGGQLALLNEQIGRFKPTLVAVEADTDRGAVAHPADRVLAGPEGLLALATLSEADLIVIATSGHAAIRPTLAAIEAGKGVALANKETIVCAGELVMAAARAHRTTIRPLDSEHSALWQAAQGAAGAVSVQRLIVTGSGGPFRRLAATELATVTPQAALRHPTWPSMGGKITIDSASLMNKGLEVIEARWLFDLPFERIDVVIHPQSIVHGLVEFADGAMLAQLALPDMRLPIAYALAWPARPALPYPRLDLLQVAKLEFEAPDPARFPCLRLAYEAGRAGGLLPTVLSAADEVAVEAFLRGALPFTGIPALIEAALAAYDGTAVVSLEAIEAADRWTQAFGQRFVAAAAWAVEAAPEGRKAQALGFLGAGVWGGLAVGPAIGAFLGSFENAALLLVLTPIPAVLALRNAPETLRERHPSAKAPSVIPRRALMPGIVLGFVNVHYPAMAGFLTLHLASTGNAAGGKAFSAYAVVILTSRFFLGGLPDRIGPRITFYVGLFSMAAGLFVLSLGPGPGMSIFCAALTGFGFSLPWPSIASTVLNQAPDYERAASVGLLTACVDLFVGASSFVDGALAHRYGYPVLYWVAIGSLAIAAVLGVKVTSVKALPHHDEDAIAEPVADMA